jgi:hypothetical protein
MKGSIHRVMCTAALLVAVVFVTAAAAQDDAQIVPFSDPSRPGKVEASLLHGSIIVRGENRRDVAVVMRPGAPGSGRQIERPERPAPPGMRRLNQSAFGFEISEERNEIKIESSSFRPNNGTLEIRVPLRTNLELGSVNGSVISVENVEGEIEVESLNGSVTLTNVAGAVVANTQNGPITVTLSRVTADKPMAFTSFNGKVDVTLPANIKATMKMRSDNGDVFTDFDVQLQQAPAVARSTRGRNGNVRIEVNKSLYGTVNGGGPEMELRSFNGSIYLRKGP